jgi:predicted Zn-dependent protease
MKTPKMPAPLPAPEPVKPPEPTAEEKARQAEQAAAAAAAEQRAKDDTALAEANAQRERVARSAGLRGRAALLSSAGEAGFRTSLGGV